MGEDFALARCLEQSPPLASITSVPTKREHPGDLIPHCLGSWAAETQQSPARVLGKCCCASSQVTRCKAAIWGKSRCFTSLQHRGFPLLLSTAQESLKIHPEFPPGPLSLASRHWWDGGTGMLSLGWISCCSVTPQVLSALPKWWMLSYHKPGSLSVYLQYSTTSPCLFFIKKDSKL